jgi:para-aminobenzoate synthetase/4-amino-4-deoxychorismate lyase
MNSWHSLPAELLALVESAPASVLLHSATPQPKPPFSRLFTEPLRILEARQPDEIPALFAGIESAVVAGCYAAGFASYECASAFEPKAAGRQSGVGDLLAWFGIYDRCFLFDHSTGAFVDGEPAGLEAFRGSQPAPACGALLEARLDLDEAEYAQRIAAIHEWIRAGDIYQLNFTVPLRLRTAESAAALYAQLIRRQPVEYAAFLHTQAGRRILSFSPELFFRLEEGENARHIVTRPMKGTAARGRTTSEDRQQAEWLRGDSKNRAENLMIVDLLRNDLGRLCRFGSVRVDDIFAVERYPTLWQMTSTVSGELRSEVGFHDLFRALFPCGSITGAPKVRAMQLIGQLETKPRGVYTGAIGFFSPQETVFSVAIRTLELEEESSGGQRGKMGVGSGIVIDSDAAGEFRECRLKAEFLTGWNDREMRTGAEEMEDRQDFALVETLLWRGGFPRLELHLDRLQDSAAYFGFVCERAAVRAALLDYAALFNTPEPRKIRLLLDRTGGLSLSFEVLSEDALGLQANPVRVALATERTDARDPLIFHKTTHRPLYRRALLAAQKAGCDDVLFFNREGELTESVIANVFIEKDGQMFTPPTGCGLLAGVERRHLLATLAHVEERVLTVDDLRDADAIYLANAVRGLRRAQIDWSASGL